MYYAFLLVPAVDSNIFESFLCNLDQTSANKVVPRVVHSGMNKSVTRQDSGDNILQYFFCNT